MIWSTPGRPYDQYDFACFDPRCRKELVACRCYQRQRSRLDQVEPFRDLRQDRCIHDAKLCVSIVRHREHLVADRKAFHSRTNVNHCTRNIDSD